MTTTLGVAAALLLPLQASPAQAGLMRPVLQLLRRKVPGLLPITARGSKESRAHAVAPLLEAGQVRFHHRAAPLVEELPRFPKGSKDLVDAFGHGALWLEARYWRGLGLKQGPMPLLLSR